jgi:hypothetical protein
MLQNYYNKKAIMSTLQIVPRNITAMACKCAREFVEYYKAVSDTTGDHYKWYCHFDDDVYLNVKSLRKLLKSLDPQGKHYLGKWSVNRRDRFIVRDRVMEHLKHKVMRGYYYFATGAAYCISRGIMDEGQTYFRDEFVNIAKLAGIPDDMAVGLIIG